MGATLDAQELYRGPFLDDGVWDVYEEYLALRTPEAHEKVWKVLAPLVGRYYGLWSMRSRTTEEADDVMSGMGVFLWSKIPKFRVTPPRGHSEVLLKHFIGYVRQVLRTGFLVALKYRALHHPGEIPQDEVHAALAVRSPHHWREGSIWDTEDRIYLEELPRAIEKQVIWSCRFPLPFRLGVQYCIERIFAGKDPSMRILAEVWGAKDPQFVVDWTTVAIRRALLSRRDDVYFGKERTLEFVLA